MELLQFHRVIVFIYLLSVTEMSLSSLIMDSDHKFRQSQKIISA